MNEFELIKFLTDDLEIKDKNIKVGFGDDCAGIEIEKSRILLTTNDTQIENIHFIKDKILPEQLGWKLISINVSDIVACGGLPKWANITIGLPNNFDINYIKGVYNGIKKALQFYNFSLVGGNTTKSKEFILDLFVIGETDRFVSRAGANVEQYLFISGYLGLSRAGLELILMNKGKYEDFEKELIKYHLEPKARIDLQEKINRYAESCIDISDGLVGDLKHIIELSGVGFVINEDKLPIHNLLKKFCKKYNKNPIDYVLYGGEDYELAFTVKGTNLEYFNNISFHIGYTTEIKDIFIKKHNKVLKIKDYSFKHF